MFKFEVMNSFKICKNFPWDWHIADRKIYSIADYIYYNNSSVNIFITPLYVYDNRRIHKNMDTFAVIWSMQEGNITSPFIFSYTFDTVSYASNI